MKRKFENRKYSSFESGENTMYIYIPSCYEDSPEMEVNVKTGEVIHSNLVQGSTEFEEMFETALQWGKDNGIN